MKSPLGKNEIGKFLSTAVQKAGLQREGKQITKQSVRKTCISQAARCWYTRELCCSAQWPQNTESLQSYKSASSTRQRRMSLTLSRARSSSEESTVSSVQDLQMASCSSSENTLTSTAVNSMMKSSVDPLLSSAAPAFAEANIGSISGCTFQIFHGKVKFVQTKKKRRLVIESDDDDWLSTFLLTRSQFFLLCKIYIFKLRWFPVS